MTERDPFHGVEPVTSQNVRAFFPEGEKGDAFYEEALATYSPDELIALRSEFNVDGGYYGELQFLSVIHGDACDCITARIDEKTQRCGERGTTTVGFNIPNIGDADFLMACSDEHAKDIISALEDQEQREDVNLYINRNGFPLAEFNTRLELKSHRDRLKKEEGINTS